MENAPNFGPTLQTVGVASNLGNPLGLRLQQPARSGHHCIPGQISTNVSNLSYGLTNVGTTSSPQVLTVSALGSAQIANVTVSANYSEADITYNSDERAKREIYATSRPRVRNSSRHRMTINYWNTACSARSVRST